MSGKETRRRNLCRIVLREVWRLKKRVRMFVLSLSSIFKLAWGLVRGLMRLRYTKTKGTTYQNRQEILKRLAMYDQSLITLFFRREKNNLYDVNAVQIVAYVKNRGNFIIGYLGKERAPEVTRVLDGSQRGNVVVFSHEITGLNKNKLGCNFGYVIIPD